MRGSGDLGNHLEQTSCLKMGKLRSRDGGLQKAPFGSKQTVPLCSYNPHTSIERYTLLGGN